MVCLMGEREDDLWRFYVDGVCFMLEWSVVNRNIESLTFVVKSVVESLTFVVKSVVCSKRLLFKFAPVSASFRRVYRHSDDLHHRQSVCGHGVVRGKSGYLAGM
jgi:ribosomal protein S8